MKPLKSLARSIPVGAILVAATLGQGVITDSVSVQAGTAIRVVDLLGATVAGPSAPLFGGNYGLVIDGQRRVWASDFGLGNNTVSRFDPQTGTTATFVAGAPAGSNESSVGPLAVSRSGVVYVGDPRDTVPGTITLLSPQGSLLSTWNVAGDGVRALAFDAAGDLWVLVASNPTTGGHVLKYSASGAFLFSIVPPNSTGLVPTALYADESGFLWIAGTPNANSVQQHDRFGNPLLIVSGTATVQNVAVAPDGTIYIASGATVRRHAGTTLLASTSVAPNVAIGISFDADGGVWVASYPPSIPFGSGAGSLRLDRFLPSGATLPLATGLSLGPVSPNGWSFNLGDMTGMVWARTIDPTGDLDSDGSPNLTEVIGGTSPFDPNEVPGTLVGLNAPQIGTTFQMQLITASALPLPYFLPFSTNPTPVSLSILGPTERRLFPVSFFAPGTFAALDPIFELSVGPSPFTPFVFPDTFGTLSASGTATARIFIPNLPLLIGGTIHGAFLTIDPSAPTSLRTISQRLSITFQ